VCDESVQWAKGLTNDAEALRGLVNPEWLMVLGTIQVKNSTLSVDTGLAMATDVVAALQSQPTLRPHVQAVIQVLDTAKAAKTLDGQRRHLLRACMNLTALVRPLLGTHSAQPVCAAILPHLKIDAL
jgi:hypothetical protein